MRVTDLAISGPPAVEPVRRGAKENAATGQKKMQLVNMSQAMCRKAPVCSGSANSTLPRWQYRWVYTAAVNRYTSALSSTRTTVTLRVGLSLPAKGRQRGEADWSLEVRTGRQAPAAASRPNSPAARLKRRSPLQHPRQLLTLLIGDIITLLRIVRTATLRSMAARESNNTDHSDEKTATAPAIWQPDPISHHTPNSANEPQVATSSTDRMQTYRPVSRLARANRPISSLDAERGAVRGWGCPAPWWIGKKVATSTRLLNTSDTKQMNHTVRRIIQLPSRCSQGLKAPEDETMRLF